MDVYTVVTAFNILMFLLFGIALLRVLPGLIYKLFDRFPVMNREAGYLLVLLAVLTVGITLFATETLTLDEDSRLGGLIFVVGTSALIFTYNEWIRDAFAGLALHFFMPIKVGDWIVANGHMGGIKQMGIFRTDLETLGLDVVSFRNSGLFAASISNLSTIPFYEVKTVLHTAHYAGYQHGIREYLADVEAVARDVQEKISPAAAKIERYKARAYLLGFGPTSDLITVVSYAEAYRDAVNEMHIAIAEAMRSKGLILGHMEIESNTEVASHSII